MKATILLLLFLVGAVFSQSICDNYGYQVSSGYYSLADLNAYSYYSYYDETTTKTWYWNICGEINNDYYSSCPEGSAVCFLQSGTPVSWVNAGVFEDYSYSVSDETELISITYYEGEYCDYYGVNRTTTFNFQCDQNAYSPVVTSINSDWDCYAVYININTTSACRKAGNYASYLDGDYSSWEGHHVHIHAFWLAFSIVIGVLVLGICCCTCVAVCRRRACRRNRQCYTRVATNNVPLQQTVVSSTQNAPHPAPTAPVQTYVPTQLPQVPQVPQYMLPQQYPVQYIAPPQYYYYMPQANMQNIPPVVPSTVPPTVPLNTHEQQVEEDEKLARQLQAQFNQE